MKWIVAPSRIEGAARVPGDKSIAHRALMIGALASGRSIIRDLPDSADVRATARCLAALGVEIEHDNGMTHVEGGELSAAPAVLDAANSGTTLRLLTGILAGCPFSSSLTGDVSLRRRPMDRMIAPLERMGARMKSDAGHAPLHIVGRHLHGITYTLPIASAQVKSGILLAGLNAEGTTSVVEPLRTRDHTERLLHLVGAAITTDEDARTISISESGPLRPLRLSTPGDISSAAFLFAAAALIDSSVEVCSVGVNPLRTGFLDALQTMGSAVEVRHLREEGGEPVADVRVSGRPTRPLSVTPDDVPRMIDELPLIALLGTCVAGKTSVSGAEELRVKESDRIANLTQQMRRLGADVEERSDGFVVRGGRQLRGTDCYSGGDHRLAMLLAIAGLQAKGKTCVHQVECAAVSFPGFETTMRELGGSIAGA